MKIAILGIKTLPAFAGADRVVENLLTNFLPGNQYHIYLLKNGVKRLPCTDTMHYIYLPAIGGKHLKPFTFFLLCTVHYFFKGSSDIAFVHNSDFGFFLPLLTLKRRVKFVGTFHGNAYDRQKWNALAKIYFRISEWLFIRLCDSLTSVSKRNPSQGKEILYIPNGVEFYPDVVTSKHFNYEEYGLEWNNYILFACGRLDSTKGLHHLLDAYLRGNFTQKLLAIGDFTHDVTYSKRIRETARNCDKIILHDKLLAKRDLMEVIKHSKVFVFPSEVEAMSMVLLEALSCKKIVVCSDIEQNIEVVGPDYKYLFSVAKKDDLLTKLRLALEEKEIDALMGRLYAQCVSKYSWSTIARQYEEVFHSVLAKAS